MKIVQINTVSGVGSTGKICVQISKELEKQKIENYILYSTGRDDYPLSIKYGDISIKFSALISKILGNYGLNSRKVTQKLIKLLDDIKPDVIHFHNLHGHNCNIELLFKYIKQNDIKILWTFHDCWAFTGYCPCFDMAMCNKWKTECRNCIQTHKFSWFMDRSNWIFYKKKQVFSSVNMTIVTPSIWLAKCVKDSFLKEKTVKVINNGIDLSVFRFSNSDFRKKYNISEDKKIILGVAYDWIPRKGTDVFIKLSKQLDYDRYQIVLVGRNKKISKKENKQIIWISQTKNATELVEIYSAADIFVNPTREDTYPTVNMEALACGTPVVTFNTGGSPEILSEKTGSIVERDDIDALRREIIRICEEQPYSREDCLEHAKKFDANDRYKDYVELYKEKLCK